MEMEGTKRDRLGRWRDFRPTAVDGHYPLYEQENYFVAPVKVNRDSGVLERSNWEAQLQELNRRGCKDYELHRFGHWLCGWFEVILVPPDSQDYETCEDIAQRLRDYPILDEEQYSSLCMSEYWSSWNDYGYEDFKRGLEEILRSWGYSEEDIERIADSDKEIMMRFYESLIPTRDYYTDRGNEFCINIGDALERLTEDDLVVFFGLGEREGETSNSQDHSEVNY